MVHDVGIMINCVGDGATENVPFFDDSSCTKSLKGFISENTAGLFKKFNLEEHLNFLIAMKDPATEDLIFSIEDMPHLIKWIVSTMDRSSNDRKTRNFQYG